MMKTRCGWSIETPDGRCPICDSESVLVVPCPHWVVVDCPVDAEPEVAVHDEVSAHYCRHCESLVSLSLNTGDDQ